MVISPTVIPSELYKPGVGDVDVKTPRYLTHRFTASIVPPASGIYVAWRWPFVPSAQTLSAVASRPTVTAAVTLHVKRVLLQISRPGDAGTTRRYGDGV